MLDIPDEVVRWNAADRADAEKIIEVGGLIGTDAALAAALARVNEAGARLNRHVYEQVDRCLRAGKLVGVLGGDHSVPYGAIARVAESHDDFAILHIDAHSDLREAYEGFEWRTQDQETTAKPTRTTTRGQKRALPPSRNER